MAQCELSGKKAVVKNKVSHSNIKTKFRARPNVQVKKLYSQVLDQSISFKLATSTLRSIEHSGGLDQFILKQDLELLSKRANTVRARIAKKLRNKKT